MSQHSESPSPDTPLDEYPVPDPSISPDALAERNCGRRNLLPLSADRALALTDSLTVYAALPDGTLELPSAKRAIWQYPPDTVFAVPKREWEKSMDFHIALNDRIGRQIQRERAFLRHKGDCVAVYQFRPDTDADRLEHVTLETARTGGLSPREAGYELVYTAPLTGSGEIAELEKRFRERPPVDYHHRSVRVSDIIAVKRDGETRAWYLDRLAYSELPGLFETVPLYRLGEQGEHLPLTSEIPLYRETGRYAQEHGELDAYFASQNANIACRDAIEEAVASHYRDWCLDTDGAVRQVREEFGYDRMLYVLAASIRHYSWDGRISRSNIRWAENFPVTPDVDALDSREDRNICFLIVKTHLVQLNMFAKRAYRDYERYRPLSAEEITGEAERIFTRLNTMREPNGPEYQSLVVQIDPKFTSRANEGDFTMLSSMMPFKSFAVKPLREVYSSGIFAQIGREESRGARKKLRKPVYKSPRSSARQKKGPAR